jgi:serine/threonine-protein kinase Chk2
LFLLQGSLPEDETDTKKPRRSDRLAQVDPDKTPVSREHHLPSPVTNNATDGSTELPKEHTATPPVAAADELTPRKAPEGLGQSQALSSPPQDTQPLSQFIDRHPALSDEVVDELKEGVWGYLVPLDPKYGDKPLVLKKRVACPIPDDVEALSDGTVQSKSESKNSKPVKDEETYEKTKVKGVAAGGYLIGRHPECGKT